MSFEHAPVTKGLICTSALTSIAVGLFDVKHYFHLQLVPHISRDHQYWRLGAHHLAFTSSTDLFLAVLLFFYVGVEVERQFGSVKYGSFALVASLISTLLEFSALLLFNRLGLNFIPGGPITLVFTILYQYSRVIPSVYRFRVFGITLSNKSFVYLLALQLATSNLPGSAVAAAIGVLSGQLYRSDLIGFNTYRVSPPTVRFCATYLLPLLGISRPPRRTNLALPEAPPEEPVSTARTSTSAAAEPGEGTNDEGAHTADQGIRTSMQSVRTSGGAVMREFVSGLTGRADRDRVGVRIPPESEVVQLTTMFPDLGRDVVVGTLQRRCVAFACMVVVPIPLICADN
ncbi:uncharacterized protein SCHCODRAFT_02256803 [Schizophyllum commune H4-8]|nr:uncharacterized protein SCHCODRAFT_02256803 [Schizophyllum commune H4-8]KAI5893590.1 hypothetical protein SCHCODRAFT_02256803 [Schizophyllum commune H4-8]